MKIEIAKSPSGQYVNIICGRCGAMRIAIPLEDAPSRCGVCRAKVKPFARRLPPAQREALRGSD